jgi:hypothetical protein
MSLVGQVKYPRGISRRFLYRWIERLHVKA